MRGMLCPLNTFSRKKPKRDRCRLQISLLGLLLLAFATQSLGWRTNVDKRSDSSSHTWSRRRTNNADVKAFKTMCPLSESIYTRTPNGTRRLEHKCPDIWYRNSTIKFRNIDYYQYDNNLNNGGGMTLQNMTAFSEGLGTTNGTAYVENLMISGMWAYTNTIHQSEHQPMPLAWSYPYMVNNVSTLHKPYVDAQCEDGNPPKPEKDCEFLQKTNLECPGPRGQRGWCGMIKMKNLRVRMLYRFDLGKVFEIVYGDSEKAQPLCRYWDFVYTSSTEAPSPGREDMNLFLSMGDYWYNQANRNVGQISFEDYPCTPNTGFDNSSCFHRFSTTYNNAQRFTSPYNITAGVSTLSLPSALGSYGEGYYQCGVDRQYDGLSGYMCPEVSMDVHLAGLDGSNEWYQISKQTKFRRQYHEWSYGSNLTGSISLEDLEPPAQCAKAIYPMY